MTEDNSTANVATSTGNLFFIILKARKSACHTHEIYKMIKNFYGHYKQMNNKHKDFQPHEANETIKKTTSRMFTIL